MNLQESIRRILREEDFIPLEDLYTVIKDYEDGFDVFIMNKDKKIGEISFVKEDKPNQYTIVDATIDDEYKGNRIYSKTIINLFKERPNIIINSVFRSPEAEKAWKYLLSDLPSNIEHKVKYYEDEETTLYQLKLKNLQESIRRILKEETDSVKNLNESKTSQHLKLMNNLLDPLKKKDCLCDIKISFDVEENYYNIYLVFNQKELHEKFSDLYGIRTYIQKMKEEVKMELESFLPIRNIFIDYYTKPNCEWSPLNESEDDKEKKIQKNLRAIKELINMVDYSEVCDMWVEYDPEDGYYAIRSKMSTKNHNTKALEKEFRFLEDSIKSLGLKVYISHPYWVEECEDKNELNESEESRQERKFTKLLNNIEEYINSNSYNSVVRVMVDYDKVMDDVIVNIFFDAEKARELGGGINSVIKKTGKKIMEDLSVFPFDFKYHIHFEKPQLNESRTNSSLNNLLNMLFDGFDDIYYDWANYMCGMGECCDPYAIGFTLPKNHYDDYIFKLVDSVKYDDDGDYPKELRDELPEVCYESPDLKNPNFDTIVFYGLYAEEIEDYMGPESNWRSDLLKLINKKFGCDAKQIIII